MPPKEIQSPRWTMVVLQIFFGIVAADPLACQPNSVQPMLPIFHLIGNVTENPNGSIKVESINDASGVTYKDGIYHVWHQCCQNHWDHVISRDLIHWQRLPPPIQPLTLKTFDGSISMLDNADPDGPVILYDAQDGKLAPARMHSASSGLGAPLDKPILGVARLDDPTDKYLVKWHRESFNPVNFSQGPAAGIAFPGPIWKEGGHWDFIGQGSLFSSADGSFRTWTRRDIRGAKVMDPVGGGHENSGQWMIRGIPNTVDGEAAGIAANVLINVAGGNRYVFATWNPGNETLTAWTAPEGAPATGQVADLEGGHANWWGASGGTDNNGRMMMVGWATPDFHGPAGPGVGVVTRLTGVREVNYDPKLQNLIANPVPELKGLRDEHLANEADVRLSPGTPYVVAGTDNGAAASADVELNFTGWSQLTASVTVGACVLGSAHDGTSGIGLSIKIDPSTKTASVTSGDCPSLSAEIPGAKVNVSRMMKGFNFPHGDLFDHEYPAGTEPEACQALCDKTLACDAWTFLKRGPKNGMSCCIKGPILNDGCPVPAPSMWSGAKKAGEITCGNPSPPHGNGKIVPLFDENVLTVRITPDRSLADAFVQGGRWSGTTAWLSKIPRKSGDSRITLYTSAEGISVSIGVWSMGCGWATPSFTTSPTL